MKSDRLLSVLLLLQAKGRATERELAERLEVSQRTIHRDLEALSAANVPVVALRGAQGGWELAEGWRTQVPGLDETELRALLMAQPRALKHPRLRAAAESAMNKLMASLPDSMREEAAAISERLHIDPNGWWDAGEDLSILPQLQDAVARDRKLAFDYVRGDGQRSSRNADPLGLVAKGNTWYLIANTPTGMRTFRISRMENVTVLATTFKRPAQFDLAEHWCHSVQALEGKRGSYPVLLMVAGTLGAKLTSWFRATQVENPSLDRPLPDGWIVMNAEFDHPDQARFMVRGLGERVRVLAPNDLRDELAAEVQRMAAAQLN